MTIVVSGGHGQLGRALVRRGAAGGHAVVALGRDALDVTSSRAIDAALAAHAPAAVINAAAYTAVDRAEHEPAAAWAVNADGAGALARACAARGIACLHVSTEHVFDGRRATPYREDDARAPLGVYGRSKAAGEDAALAAGATVVRTSWLFAGDGVGFVPTLVERARAGERLRVVDEVRGRPTWADHLAEALLALARLSARPPIVHYAGEPPVSRVELAQAIVDELARLGVARGAVVEPVADWPGSALRPRAAILDTHLARSLGLPAAPWREGLEASIAGPRAAPSP